MIYPVDRDIDPRFILTSALTGTGVVYMNTVYNCRLPLLGDFLWAGCSALMLAIPQVFPQLQFVFLFALVPFLWKLKKAGFIESACLGFILALSYGMVIIPDFFALSVSAIRRILMLMAAFSLFGLLLNRLKTFLGFNPVFAAFLWLPFQYFFWRNAQFSLLFSQDTGHLDFMVKVAALFGLLVVSFIIILVNSLLAAVADRLYSGSPVAEKVPSGCKIRFTGQRDVVYAQYNLSYDFSPRAPPLARAPSFS
jgi:hypothetical protein